MSESERNSVKTKLLENINTILDKNNVQELDTLTTISSSNAASYLGNIRVFDENILDKLESEINTLFDQYGKSSLRIEEIVSCCEPTYKNISFKVDVRDQN
jgi:hypothetical protein